jgi:hypothetical protein
MSTVTKTKRTKKTTEPKSVPEICIELQRLQRNRSVNMQSRIMINNRLLAVVARFLGYEPSLEESARAKAIKAAQDHIKKVLADEIESEQKALILNAYEGIKGFVAFEESLEDQMKKLAAQLPVAKWATAKSQKGLGLLSLAKIIGETGDLSNYTNPGKVWKRLGLAPFTSKGHTHAASTWRSKSQAHHALEKEEWTALGYSPRRRSVMFTIAECLMRANGDGIYKRRYDTVKETALRNRPDWTTCQACEGTGRAMKAKKACERCKGEGKVKKHCDLHARLVMTKLLIKNLWIEWNPDLVVEQPW